MITKKVYTLLTILYIGLPLMYAQDPNVEGGNSTVRMTFTKVEAPTTKTPNEAKNIPAAVRTFRKGIASRRPTGATEAGSTAGDLSVSLAGAANYSIPIAVPPGIQDVVPTLGLQYTSQGANGLAGWGWNVSGLSTISRLPATKYYDQKHKGINFKDDRFALDGQRLLLTSGTYGAHGSVYQTESYSNIKVIAYGSSPYGSTYGPSYFIVYYPNGASAWYGNSGNSRSKLEWAIFRWQDPQGNYMDYQYQSDHGLLSIKTIAYGGRVGGTAPTNRVTFSYATRSRPEQIYVGGYSFTRTQLLQSIQVSANGTPYRTYQLTHTTTSLGYERLSTVQEYNAQHKALAPITFGYEHTDSWMKDRVRSGDLYPGFSYKSSSLLTGDYDGDGRTDAIFYNKTIKDKVYLHTRLYHPISLAYRINTGRFEAIFSSTILANNKKILPQQAITTVSETFPSNSSTATIRFRTFAMAAHGPAHQYDKVWKVPKSKYKTDIDCRKSVYRPIPRRYISGDFNGDGITDVLAIDKQYEVNDCSPGMYPSCSCYSSIPSNQHNSAKVHLIDLNRTVTANFTKVAGYFQNGVGSGDRIVVADHNGDGKQDIYHIKEGRLSIYTLNAANNLVLLHQEVDAGLRVQHPVLLGDYNGDGKTDLAIAEANKSKNWRFFMSTGTHFNKATKSLPFAYHRDELIRGNVVKSSVRIHNPYYEYRYTAQDVNADGKTDLVMHNTIAPYSAHDKSVEYISVYKNTQHSATGIPTFSYEAGYTDTSGQVGKFGTPIVLEFNRTNGNLEYGYVNVGAIYMYEFAKDHKKDVTLQRVTNNGITTRIAYEALGFPEPHGPVTYAADYSQYYPYVNVNRAHSLSLVKQLTEESTDVKRYQEFRYHGAVSNIHIGFQGFLTTKRSNWYGDGVGTLWTISKHDVTKKGAVTEQWVTTSYNEGSNYMRKTTHSYYSHLARNKMLTHLPTRTVQHNALTGVTTTKTLTYDTYNNPVTEHTTYPGGEERIAYTYSNNSTANNHNYHLGRLTKKAVTTTIGGNAFTTEERYTYRNNLLTAQRVKGQGTPWNIDYFTYDAFGNVTQKKEVPSGLAARTETFTYDTSGRFLVASTDIEGLTTKTTYDAFGNPITSTNPYNQVTRFTYDGWNRLISETNYLGKITTFAYTALPGGGIRKTTNYPQGADELEEYNALGWMTKSGVLGIKNQWTYQSTRYDVAGRALKESEPYFSTPNQWNTTAYDEYGRVIASTSFTGRVATIQYNGLVTTVHDGTKTVKTTKDGSGNTIKMEDPGGTITYTYHGNGVMKSANYGSHVVRTELDGWGRKAKLVDPSAGTYTYRHNAVGDVLEETTPKGSTVYTYTSHGKLSAKKMSGEATNMHLQYTYHPTTKLLTAIQGTNARTQEHYAYTYVYDTHKRLKRTREQNGKATFEQQLTRDAYGRIATETYVSRTADHTASSTVTVRNHYDPTAGVLTEIKDATSNTPLWKLQEVNARGQATTLRLGNGMVKKRTYDAFGYLTHMVDQTAGTTPKTALNVAYRFDTQRGNVTYRKNTPLGWQESFTYDHLDRLTHISGAVKRTQRYDGRGRITENSVLGSYTYANASSYRLQGVNLNPQGDLYAQNHPVQRITYNAYKKPVSIAVQGKARVDFDYGILQHRSHAYYGGNEEHKADRRYHKHYSAITPVAITVDQQGTTKITTYLGGDEYTAPIVHIKQTGSGKTSGYHYLHRDYLGSILAISDHSGTVQEQRQFGAWGEVDKYKRQHSTLDFTNDTTLLNRGYTGHEHFMGVALLHMNGRMYDATLGRFLSPDNFIQAPFSTQSFNRYGYVWNNPLKFTDHSGEFIIAAIIIGAAVGAYFGGVQANGGSWNPFKWNWSSGATWSGVLLGAVIGGVSGVAGGAAAAALTPMITTASGFIGGAISGFIAGAVGGAISGAFMSQLPGGNGDFWGGALKGSLMGAVGGAVLGGTIGGIKSASNGKSFWTGRDLAPKVVPTRPTAKTISSLKARSIHDVAPKNELSTQKLDLRTPAGSQKPITGKFKNIGGLDGRKSFNFRAEPVNSRVAAGVGKQSLNQFNSTESLIKGAGKLSPVKGGFQGFVKGDGASIFKNLTQGAKPLPNGRFLLSDGTNIGKHFSSNTGAFTINMNRGGKLFKIRINQ